MKSSMDPVQTGVMYLRQRPLRIQWMAKDNAVCVVYMLSAFTPQCWGVLEIERHGKAVAAGCTIPVVHS